MADLASCSASCKASFLFNPSASRSATPSVFLRHLLGKQEQERRAHAQANNRNFRSLVLPRRYFSIEVGVVRSSHSCSVIAIASFSLAPTDFAAGNASLSPVFCYLHRVFALPPLA